jgi:murein DD-endopeptidase MepM/ murein hydrolase activator NlpD
MMARACALACAAAPITGAAAQSALVEPAVSAPRVALGDAAVATDAAGTLLAAASTAAATAPTATITIGPEAVGDSAPVYAIRSQAEGAGLTVTFSAIPPAAPLPGGSSALAANMSAAWPAGWPVAGVLTSRYGPRVHPLSGAYRQHQGIDLAAREGTPIRATGSGVVSTAGWAGNYGLLVSLDHGGAVQTRYAHMSRLNVGSGQRVNAGDIIGFVGSTGNSTGPHVHYEIRQNGRALNPLAS